MMEAVGDSRESFRGKISSSSSFELSNLPLSLNLVSRTLSGRGPKDEGVFLQSCHRQLFGSKCVFWLSVQAMRFFSSIKKTKTVFSFVLKHDTRVIFS